MGQTWDSVLTTFCTIKRDVDDFIKMGNKLMPEILHRRSFLLTFVPFNSKCSNTAEYRSHYGKSLFCYGGGGKSRLLSLIAAASSLLLICDRVSRRKSACTEPPFNLLSTLQSHPVPISSVHPFSHKKPPPSFLNLRQDFMIF